MSVKSKLAEQLHALGPFAAGQHCAAVDDGSVHLECDLVALDGLGCAFLRLAVRASALAGAEVDKLKKTASNLSAKLTYLLEPISPIETDAEGCVVQLRSNPPQHEDDRTSYYELLVTRTGEISLCRYSRTTKQSRQVVPAYVTREVLLRLAEDLSAAAG